MLRRLYTTGVVILIGIGIFQAPNDPRTVALWNYVTAREHSPAEFLIIGTFVLVLIDRLDKMVEAWGKS
jgi:hypothetical protein